MVEAVVLPFLTRVVADRWMRPNLEAYAAYHTVHRAGAQPKVVGDATRGGLRDDVGDIVTEQLVL